MAIKIFKNKPVTEEKQPRIVEYTSPERQAVLDRIRKIDGKFSSSVTDEDKEFLKSQGLEYDNGTIRRNGKALDIPNVYSWRHDKESEDTRKIDFVDLIDKQVERGTAGSYRSTPHKGSGQSFRTSDELKTAKDKLEYSKKYNGPAAVRRWQKRLDAEETRLKNLRADSENKAWRAEQNKEMQKPLKTLKNINHRLKDNPDDDSWDNFSYDSEIRKAEKRKAEREAELLQRYKDELDRYQQEIDNRKAEKQQALDWKNKVLKRDEKSENPDD